MIDNIFEILSSSSENDHEMDNFETSTCFTNSHIDDDADDHSSLSIDPMKKTQGYELIHTNSRLKPYPQHQVKEQLEQKNYLSTVQHKDKGQKDVIEGKNGFIVDVPSRNFSLKQVQKTEIEYNMQSMLRIRGKDISVEQFKEIKITQLLGVEQLDVNLETTVKKYPSIKNASLEYLNTQISYHSNLKVVQISFSSFNHDYIKTETFSLFLTTLANLKNLEEINLQLEFVLLSQENVKSMFWDILQGLTKLKAFAISYSDYYGYALTEYLQGYDEKLHFSKSLEQISIKGLLSSEYQFANVIHNDIGNIQQLKLQRLDIYFYEDHIGCEKFKYLKSLTQLEELKAILSGPTNPNQLAQALFENLVCCTKLTSLDIKLFTNFQKDPEANIFDSMAKIPKDDLAYIASKIPQYKHLKFLRLHFEDLQVTKEGFDELVKGIAEMAALETLQLNMISKYGDHMIYSLIEYLPSLKTIQSLEVQFKTNFHDVLNCVKAVARNAQQFKNLNNLKVDIQNSVCEKKLFVCKKFFRKLNSQLMKANALQTAQIIFYLFTQGKKNYRYKQSDYIKIQKEESEKSDELDESDQSD